MMPNISLNNRSLQHTRFIILCALFLSGANGLVMEIVFRRQLLLSLGVTHYSVGTVLTVFMAGLAIGSFLFGRIADKALAHESEIWHTLIHEKKAVSPGLYAALCRAYPPEPAKRKRHRRPSARARVKRRA